MRLARSVRAVVVSLVASRPVFPASAAWLLAALLALTVPALPAHAQSAAPGPQAGAPSAGPAQVLIDLAAHHDEAHLDRAVQAFMDRQLGPRLGMDITPPESIYRAVDPVCDLDGDGTPDLITNEMQLRKAGQYDSGTSFIRALSGKTGLQIWSEDNDRYGVLNLAHGYSSARAGEPSPAAPPNVLPTIDVNKDGVCDLLAYGYSYSPESVDAPLFGEPGLDIIDVTVKMLDGRNGTTLWQQTLASDTAHVNDPLLQTTANQAILGFPTGLAYFDSPSGPRVLVKTTDLRYDYAHDIFGAGGLVFHTDNDGFYVVNAQTGEHYLEADAATGATVWSKDFPIDPNADETNMTWISGVAGLDGDGNPDIVLDQFTLSNPRGSTAKDPTDPNSDLYKNGRGMRMMALAGSDGHPLWSTAILDPLAVQTPPPNEENLEILSWTYGTVLPGRNGTQDLPVAQYLTEDFVGGTPNGRHRTHFLPLDPATGAVRWAHVQQGWGFLGRLGDHDGMPVVAAATLDWPEHAQPGAGFPAKSTYYTGLDSLTGQALWTTEVPFAQDSTAAYEVGLHQVHDALAPVDVDGDGLLDPVTVSQYVSPAGNDQVFLATAQQRFDVLSGATGKVLRSMDLWGSSGLLLPCSDGRSLVFAVGHAKRLDLERVSLQDSSAVWRRSIWYYNQTRSSTESMDLVSMDGVCSQHADGSLAYGVNMEAFSFFRRFEILPLFGVLDATGSPSWRTPTMESDPPAPSLFETLHRHDVILLPPGADTWIATAGALAVGSLLGWAAAGPVGRALAARRRRLDPLGIALLLMMVPAGALPSHEHHAADASPALAAPHIPEGMAHPALAPSAAPLALAPAAGSGVGAPSGPPLHLRGNDALGAFVQAMHDAPDSSAAVRAMSAYYASRGIVPDVTDRFDQNGTLSYPLNIGDQDGDGVDDIALDLYCLEGNSCYDEYPNLEKDPVAYAQATYEPWMCGPHHRIIVVSGAHGDHLWDAPLDRPHPLSNQANEACGAEAVIGKVPLPDNATGILIERYEAMDTFEGWAGRTFNTTIYLLDAATGASRWSISEPGIISPKTLLVLEQSEVARSSLLNVFLEPGTERGVPDRDGHAGLTILVEGIGYETADINTVLTPFGWQASPRVADDYRPMEWLERLDPVTGKVLYRVDSFTPQAGLSEVPLPSQPPSFHIGNDFQGRRQYSPYEYPYWLPIASPVRHWSAGPCCGDLNGDGVADLVFITVSWNPLQSSDATGPYRLDSDLVVFDGATGSRLSTTRIVQDASGEGQRDPYAGYLTDSFEVTTQAVGDADGDGKADILVHTEYMDSDPHWTISVHNGATGAVLWSQDFPRAQFVIPLGDVDGDGGNDLLFFQWFAKERLQGLDGDYNNVTVNPLFIRSGATGEILRTDHTVEAPIDLAYILGNAAFNGLPDVDGDRVGDVPTDDPIYLPDFITLHQVSYLSGRTGEPLMSFPAAGAFAYPVRLGDVNGDGRDEIAVLSGDANDLWMTYRDGRDGHALWAYRAVPLKTSSYAWAVPRFQFLDMVTGPGPTDRGFLLDFQMDIQSVDAEYDSYYVEVGGTSGETRYLSIGDHIVPQVTAVLDGAHGLQSWAYPQAGDVDASRVASAAPGTLAVLALRERAEPPASYVARHVAAETALPAGGFAAGFLATLAPIALVVRRKGGFP